jgi:hypothetical protein
MKINKLFDTIILLLKVFPESVIIQCQDQNIGTQVLKFINNAAQLCVLRRNSEQLLNQPVTKIENIIKVK